MKEHGKKATVNETFLYSLHVVKLLVRSAYGELNRPTQHTETNHISKVRTCCRQSLAVGTFRMFYHAYKNSNGFYLNRVATTLDVVHK